MPLKRVNHKRNVRCVQCTTVNLQTRMLSKHIQQKSNAQRGQSHCLSQSLSLSPEGPRHWFGVPEYAECTRTGACVACNRKCEMESFELKGQEGRKYCLNVAAAMHVKHDRNAQRGQSNGVKLDPGMAPKPIEQIETSCMGNPMESTCSLACFQTSKTQYKRSMWAIHWSQPVAWHASKACKTPKDV